MKTQLLTVSLLALTLVFTACGSAEPEVTSDTTSTTEPLAEVPSDDSTLSSTFAGLLTGNKNMYCTYSKDEPDGMNQGALWIETGAKRVAARFTVSNTAEAAQTYNMVINGDTKHFWNDDEATGFTMGAIEGEFIGTMPNDDTSVGVTDDEIVDFTCSDWRVDEAVFTVPDHIEFTDLSAMLEQFKDLPKTIGTNSEDACNFCDLAPSEEEKNECKAALGCK